MPFLLEERRKRIAGLRDIMNRADVSLSEKYRRVVEAYQIEMDYGRTIEAYDGRLGEGDDARTVQFLRIGRVVLMYQTLDGRRDGLLGRQQPKLGRRQRLPAVRSRTGSAWPRR